MKLSVIIPANSEERYLPATLAAINTAAGQHPCEVVVVDNGSTDGTKAIAEQCGAITVSESVHNIGKVRNTGARHAGGDVLIFVDADTLVPPGLFVAIANAMQNERCVGGAVAVDYTGFTRRWVRWYHKTWGVLGDFLNMKQGAAQFWKRAALWRDWYEDAIR